MPLFWNTDQIGARYGAQVQEFRKLYEFHSLKTGSPEDFLQLAPKLALSEGFRLDFSDRVRRVRDGERGRMSAAEMLTIAGIAIGGTGIAGAELDLFESAGTVQVLLAGVGGWREPAAGGGNAVREELPAAADREADAEEGPDHLEDDLAGDGPAVARREMEVVRWEGQRPAAGGGGEVSPEMKEALARLEMASLQLKVYLDDIDRRMGRIEPHLDDLTAMVQTSAEHFQKLERDGRDRRREDSDAVPETPERRVGPRRLRADEAIAAAMEMASREKERESAAPVEVLERIDEEQAAEKTEKTADAGEVVVLEAAPAKIFARFTEEDRAMEPTGRPIGWGRREEIVLGAKRVDEAAPAVEPEVRRDGTRMVLADGQTAALATSDPKPATVVARGGAQGRARMVWGAAATVFLLAAASLGYVYQPWRAGAGQARAESVSAGAGGPNEAVQGETRADGAGPVARGSDPLRNSAASASALPGAGVAGRGSVPGRRGEDAVRRPAGAQTKAAQAVGVPVVANAGGDRANVAPRSTTTVQPAASGTGTAFDAAVKDQAKSPVDAPKDRVAGARAADVPRVARVEDLHPEATAERAATGGGPSPHMETTMVSKAVAPAMGGAAGAGAGDVPRASIGRPEVAPTTIGVSLISSPQPIYPQQARQMGVEGKVVIQATVNKTGLVTSVRVVEGPFLLRQSAQDAVLRRRYKPYLLHGDATEFQTLVTLNYRLSK